MRVAFGLCINLGAKLCVKKLKHPANRPKRAPIREEGMLNSTDSGYLLMLVQTGPG